ncbi:MAG: hypothetical protein AB7N65_25760 [Vicinamibacterales bacterium]
MRVWLGMAAVVGATLLGSPASADVTIAMNDGYVSVDAKNATVSQILAEWARVGQVRVLNAERISGTPVTLHLVQLPEAQALEIVLRSVSGYMAAPRSVPLPNASRFDRILVMPTSTPPRTTQMPTQPAQPFQAPPVQVSDDMDDQDPGDQMPPSGPPQRGPVFPQYPNPAVGGGPVQRAPVFAQPPMPQSQPATPQGLPPMQAFPGASSGSPGAAPIGVAAPGMVVQPPQNVPPEPQ